MKRLDSLFLRAIAGAAVAAVLWLAYSMQLSAVHAGGITTVHTGPTTADIPTTSSSGGSVVYVWWTDSPQHLPGKWIVRRLDFNTGRCTKKTILAR